MTRYGGVDDEIGEDFKLVCTFSFVFIPPQARCHGLVLVFPGSRYLFLDKGQILRRGCYLGCEEGMVNVIGLVKPKVSLNEMIRSLLLTISPLRP